MLRAWDLLRAEMAAVDAAVDRLDRVAPHLAQATVDTQAAALRARSEQALDLYGGQIQGLIGDYRTVLSSRLAVLGDLGFTDLADDTAAVLSPPAGLPAQVHAWWDSLTPRAQAGLIHTRPELIGNLDCVPAAARDAANRDRLPRETARLDAQIAADTARREAALAEPLYPGDGRAGRDRGTAAAARGDRPAAHQAGRPGRHHPRRRARRPAAAGLRHQRPAGHRRGGRR